MNLKKWLLAFVAIVSLWAAGAQPAWGQVPCSEATLQAIKKLGLQTDSRKAAKILMQLDPTGALAGKFGDVLDVITLGKVAGDTPIVDGALAKMLQAVNTFSDTPQRLQALQLTIESLDRLRVTFNGIMPEGIFNKADIGDGASQAAAWVENLTNLGQLFEVPGYHNLVDAGVLPANVEPVFGPKFSTSLGDLECDVLVGLVCIDFKFTNNGTGSANWNTDSPQKAAELITNKQLTNAWFAISRTTQQAHGTFAGVVISFNRGRPAGTIALIDAGDFGLLPAKPGFLP